MKVGKEEVAGLVRAVELFLEQDEEVVLAEWKRKAEVVASYLQGKPGIDAQVLVGDHRSRPPVGAFCFVRVTSPALGQGRDIIDRLARGNPSVRVRTQPDGFFVCPMTLSDGEEIIVGEQIVKALAG